MSSAIPSGAHPTTSDAGRPRREGRTYFAEGELDAVIEPERAAALVDALLAALGPLRRVLLLPPDATRRHSGAGELTALLYRRLAPTTEVQVLPALGTHAPMHPAPGGHSREEITRVGYVYVELAAAFRRYDPARLAPGPNVMADGEEIFFLPNPAVGLWSTPERLAGG